MKELTIHHFPAKGRRRARMRVSYRPESGAQPQEKEAEFKFAVTDEQRRLIQWYLEKYLIYPWAEFRTRAQQAEELMERLGVELFDAIFGKGCAPQALYRENIANDLASTRIVIHANSPEGIALPWEFMHDSTRGEYGDLARRAYAFVRSSSDLVEKTPANPAESETFNILMVICRPGGENDAPFQSVARPLLELFRPHRDRIRLDVLRPPTFEQLSRVLSEKPDFYHVLHFDGHGAFPQGGDPARFYAQTGAQGRLLFEGEDGKPREVTGEELGGLLAGKGVPLVLLNACQSGMTHPEALYPSVGNQLLKAGARGVVAMAYSVYVQTAVRFMARLYEGLMKGEELSRAVALAREELRSHPQRFSPIGEIELRDWVVPVVYEAAPIQIVTKPLGDMCLDPNILEDQQRKAGTEIDCPEPPAFGFVGRDDVILELERAFQTETIVLLDGMAGIGKTEMAAGFARWRAETGGLNGPIFFFRFEHHLPLAHVCDRVGQVFQKFIKEQLQVEWRLLNAEKRPQVALAILKQAQCLMIWDNFEPVAGFPTGTPSAWTAEEQKELRDFLSNLRGGQTKVLLTTHRDEPWLGNIYRRVELCGLKLPEAQELAVRVLKRAGSDPQQIKSLPQYNDLLTYLRGNPLAIQVILPELKTAMPDELLKALQAGEAKLSQGDPKEGRERSLFASLTYRFNAFDTTLRQRLSVLGLFQGFVTADVLAAICSENDAPELIRGLGRDDWVGTLDVATEIGLLRRVTEGGYTAHPALPWFFHNLLHEAFADHLDRLECAFARAYNAAGRHLVNMFQTNTQVAVFLLRSEENNLTYALCLSRQHGCWDHIEGILYGLRTLLVTQGRWAEWERLIADIEAEIEDTNSQPLPERETLWISLLGHRSEIAHYRRDFDEAEHILMLGKAHFQQHGDDQHLAATLHDLGVIEHERRQFEKAEQWYRQALPVFEGICDEHGQAKTLHQLGIIAQERPDVEEAERRYRQSLDIKKRIGDERGQAQTLRNLGNIAFEQDQFQKAKRHYQQSFDICQRVQDEHGQAQTLHNLGNLAFMQGQFDEAEDLYRQSLDISERIGNEQGKAQTFHQLGMIAEERRHFKEAERWYGQSLDIKERINDKRGHALTLGQLGSLAQKLSKKGGLQQAERLLNECIQRCKEQSDLTSAVTLFRERARQRVRMRAYDQARWDYKKVISLCEELNDMETLAEVEVELAELEYRSGLSKDALHHLEHAEQHFRANGDRERVADIHNILEEIRSHPVLQ